MILLIFTFECQVLLAQNINATSQLNNDTIAHPIETKPRYLQPGTLVIPGTFLIYAGLKPFIKGIEKLDDTIYTNIKTNHAGFHTNAEDYLMWAPSASLYFLDACKVKTKHNFKEHLVLDAGSIIIAGGVGYAMRLISRNINVYKTYGTKFPSGHTANAFRSAELFHQELKDNNKLISYSGYVVATAVGVLRIYNKDHLLTEVLAGAGLGILSTKLTYWIFDKVKDKKKQID
ncbi:MAG TPA: phosphatase PAP2 family protein [Ginsengibacter sp.]